MLATTFNFQVLLASSLTRNRARLSFRDKVDTGVILKHHRAVWVVAPQWGINIVAIDKHVDGKVLGTGKPVISSRKVRGQEGRSIKV